MTKQEYIQTKTSNAVMIVYEFYKEKFDHKKHRPFLTEQEFFPYIQMSMDLNNLFVSIQSYYDQKFNVTTILDNRGNIITYY
jgi:predicted N-acyltransferase